MLIIDDDFVLNSLDEINNNVKPVIKTQQLQIHIDYLCGCKVTQDKKGNGLMPCKNHSPLFEPKRDGKIFHRYIN